MVNVIEDMSLNGIPRLIHANFFFVDIVGLSDPNVSTTATQVKKIESLHSSIRSCASFRSTSRDSLLVLPTGDGMAIGFLQGPANPLTLAIELHRSLARYNQDRILSDSVRVRIGIHSGPAFVVKDILNKNNIWGPGIIIARRVMDIGNAGHILLSSRIAEDLRELSDEYKQIIKPLHDYSIKHGQSLLIYSAYGTGFGNPIAPTGGSYQRSRIDKETIKLINKTIYPYVEVNMVIRDPNTMLVHYKRLYEIRNISDEPIRQMLHQIGTDIRKTFYELNLKAYDEHNSTLKISSINVDKPYKKEFTTIFNKPVTKGETGRHYILEYDVEEPYRYFENAFTVNCQRFVVTVDYPLIMDPPVVYNVNLKNNRRKLCKTQPIVEKKGNIRNIAKWEAQNIVQGECFSFKWELND
jgi:hypothetical protein